MHQYVEVGREMCCFNLQSALCCALDSWHGTEGFRAGAFSLINSDTSSRSSLMSEVTLSPIFLSPGTAGIRDEGGLAWPQHGWKSTACHRKSAGGAFCTQSLLLSGPIHLCIRLLKMTSIKTFPSSPCTPPSPGTGVHTQSYSCPCCTLNIG